MKYKGILFDLDGTLVDTLEDLTDAMNWALRQLNLPTHTAESCRQMIGYGTHEFARRALPPGREDLTETLRTLMMQYYDQHCLQKSRPYDGFDKVLPVLKQKGIRLAVISNKNHPQTVKIVEYYFGKGTFDFICGMSDHFQPKPAPDMALAALEALSLEPQQAVLIGDSDIDVFTAQAAGLEAIGAGWGFRSPEVLRQAGARQILTHPTEILELVC
ncbi:MAG TPA: HAD family hydrolase [Anaerohalosphaeraceae bacterium]|nr:HAD family hydrolase [Anaerohalosphaeraceae bacterium]HPB93069.1 HAD family hydrolase [Anaerohalosphaeraceae bacterium]HRT23358.1 HAD family hydrolase [Anaerohalosphaeraceae bacterium]HRU14998.1 HAD family hydrolase [Anaerohalosphaeraceae bacterium]